MWKWILPFLLLPVFAEAQTVGTGYNCDPAQFDYCEDNRIVYQIGTDTITVNFESQVKIGRFADGVNACIVPGPGQFGISSITSSLAGSIGADVNPVAAQQGIMDGNWYDPSGHGQYSATEDVTTNLPWRPTMQCGSQPLSLVVGVEEPSRASCNDTGRDCLALSTILTILPQMPTDYCKTTIRPTAHGDTKDMLTVADFDFNLPIRSDISAPADAHDQIMHTWAHTFEFMSDAASIGSEPLRAWRSQRAIGDDYGAAVGKLQAQHLAWLYASNYVGDKTQALAAMMAYGKDTYDACYNGGSGQICFPYRGAGNGIGVTFYGFLYSAFLNDKGVDSPFEHLSSLSADIENVPFVPDALHQVKNGVVPTWGDTCSIASYFDGMLQGQCFADATGTCVQSGVGDKKCADPTGQIDGQEKKAGTSYFNVTAGFLNALAGHMELLPSLKAAYNYPAITTYAKRIYNVGVHTQPDDCAPPDPRELHKNHGGTCDPFRSRGCDYYTESNTGTITWGIDQYTGQCIKNNMECIDDGTQLLCTEQCGKGQNGRFPALHAQGQVTHSYAVPEIFNIFNTIVP